MRETPRRDQRARGKITRRRFVQAGAATALSAAAWRRAYGANERIGVGLIGFGLVGRGLLVPGAWADVVVFDPATIADRATYDAPHQYPVGIRHVLVNGVPVVRDGEVTGARPGRVLRWRQSE